MSCIPPTHDVNQLLRTFAPRVRLIAMKLWGRLPDNIELDDLIQMGLIGLWEAALKFSEHLVATEKLDNSEAAFMSYAAPRIKGSMLDHLRSTDNLSRNDRRIVRSLQEKVDAQICAGKQGSIFQAANELDIKPSEAHALLKMASEITSSNMARGVDTDSGSNFTLVDDFGSTDSQETETSAMLRTISDLLPDILAEFNEREQRVLHAWITEEQTLEELGSDMGVSESRVCQIRGMIIKRLPKAYERASQKAACVRHPHLASIFLANVEGAAAIRKAKESTAATPTSKGKGKKPAHGDKAPSARRANVQLPSSENRPAVHRRKSVGRPIADASSAPVAA